MSKRAAPIVVEIAGAVATNRTIVDVTPAGLEALQLVAEATRRSASNEHAPTLTLRQLDTLPFTERARLVRLREGRTA